MRQSEEAFQLFIGGDARCGDLHTEPQRVRRRLEPGAERIEGYKIDEIMGKHFSCFYLPEAIALGEPQRELLTAIEQGNTEDDGWRVRNE